MAATSQPPAIVVQVAAPKRGASTFDVVVHARQDGWGFVTTDARTIPAPLVYQGGGTYVAHVVVRSGTIAPNVHATVSFIASDGPPIAYRVPQAFALDTPPAPKS